MHLHALQRANISFILRCSQAEKAFLILAITQKLIMAINYLEQNCIVGQIYYEELWVSLYHEIQKRKNLWGKFAYLCCLVSNLVCGKKCQDNKRNFYLSKYYKPIVLCMSRGQFALDCPTKEGSFWKITSKDTFFNRQEVVNQSPKTRIFRISMQKT